MELKGYDGTDMNHPGYKLVCANLAREVGLYKKRSPESRSWMRSPEPLTMSSSTAPGLALTSITVSAEATRSRATSSSPPPQERRPWARQQLGPAAPRRHSAAQTPAAPPRGSATQNPATPRRALAAQAAAAPRRGSAAASWLAPSSRRSSACSRIVRRGVSWAVARPSRPRGWHHHRAEAEPAAKAFGKACWASWRRGDPLRQRAVGQPPSARPCKALIITNIIDMWCILAVARQMAASWLAPSSSRGPACSPNRPARRATPPGRAMQGPHDQHYWHGPHPGQWHDRFRPRVGPSPRRSSACSRFVRQCVLRQLAGRRLRQGHRAARWPGLLPGEARPAWPTSLTMAHPGPWRDRCGLVGGAIIKQSSACRRRARPRAPELRPLSDRNGEQFSPGCSLSSRPRKCRGRQILRGGAGKAERPPPAPSGEKKKTDTESLACENTRENASNLPLPLLGASSTLQPDQSLSNRSQPRELHKLTRGAPLLCVLKTNICFLHLIF